MNVIQRVCRVVGVLYLGLMCVSAIEPESINLTRQAQPKTTTENPSTVLPTDDLIIVETTFTSEITTMDVVTEPTAFDQEVEDLVTMDWQNTTWDDFISTVRPETTTEEDEDESEEIDDFSRKCHFYEFACDNGRCISSDKYCNGKNDCGDKSDEAPTCNWCNRTFSGHELTRYHLKLPDSLNSPYLCNLTFIAAGGEFGDIVHLKYHSFSIGYYDEFNRECFDGYMQILDGNIQSNGYFCDSFTTSMHPKSFYSEYSVVSVILHLTNTSSELDLGFRFLKRPVFSREGTPEEPIHRGYDEGLCERVFLGCHAKSCRAQSPNWPGVYLRNMSCQTIIRQEEVPHGKIAIISIHQNNGEKINIGNYKSQTEDELLFNCTDDYIEVFDGDSPSSPSIIKFCGSGPLHSISSSSSNMLIAFHTNEAGYFHSHGYELNIEVEFIDMLPGIVLSTNSNCEFEFRSSDHVRGKFRSLQQWYKPITCSYAFYGAEHEILWIAFYKYKMNFFHHKVWQDPPVCQKTLSLFDSTPQNASEDTLVGKFCEMDGPRLCIPLSEIHHKTPHICKPNEKSYLSKGPNFFIQFKSDGFTGNGHKESDFVVKYEFINVFQTGTPVENSACDRIFDSKPSSKGLLSSPQNALLFGRGGNSFLKCVYKFVTNGNEGLQLNLKSLRIEDQNCVTKFNKETFRYECVTNHGSNATEVSGIKITEGENRFSACFCEVHWGLRSPLSIVTFGTEITLEFVVFDMKPDFDASHISFEAEYIFFQNDCGTVKLNSSLEEYTFKFPDGKSLHHIKKGFNRCLWSLEVTRNKLLYLKITDFSKLSDCETTKILFYFPNELKPFKMVCEEDLKLKDEIFPKEWNSTDPREFTSKILMELISSKNESQFKAKWIEFNKAPLIKPGAKYSPTKECGYPCPEVPICIDQSLVCDKKVDCPTTDNPGFADETPEMCAQTEFPWFYVGIGAVSGLFLILIIVLIIKCCFFRKKKPQGTSETTAGKDEIQMTATVIDKETEDEPEQV